ncbi:MAG: hypothetical protein H0U79_04260 [Solirubrobacterales bacterium]|nr:hypothetical protein [Solirubrobacterales bacterium]
MLGHRDELGRVAQGRVAHEDHEDPRDRGQHDAGQEEGHRRPQGEEHAATDERNAEPHLAQRALHSEGAALEVRVHAIGVERAVGRVVGEVPEVEDGEQGGQQRQGSDERDERVRDRRPSTPP